MGQIPNSVIRRAYCTLQEEIEQKILCLMEDHSNDPKKVEEELKKFFLIKMSEPMAAALTSAMMQRIFPK